MLKLQVISSTAVPWYSFVSVSQCLYCFVVYWSVFIIMKLDPVSICFYLFLMMTIVEAQTLISKLNKPIVDLIARHQVTTTPRLPEERRKLSVFPKNMAKYVVTSKPYSKVRTYSPWEISTKKPLMLKLIPNDARTSKMAPVTRPTLMKVTYQTPAEVSKEDFRMDDVELALKKKEENQRSSSNRNGARANRMNSRFVSRDYEPQAESTDAVSTVFPMVKDEKTNQDSSTVPSVAGEMLELERQKRLSMQNHGLYNNIDVPNKVSIYSAEERKDNNEFIFLPYKPVDSTQPTNIIGLDEDLEIATEVVWLEEAPTYSRSKRT